MLTLKQVAEKIIHESIDSVMPEPLIKSALVGFDESKKVVVISIGKAAWRMAKAASEVLGATIKKGIILTKYDHSLGDISGFTIFEAGHPLPDANSLKATRYILDITSNLKPDEFILLLLSGGGSALFELPLPGIGLEQLVEINKNLLNSGASIAEINTIRKHLSAVKGGRFAALIAPTKIKVLTLSDVIGNDPSIIASGPASTDSSSLSSALKIIEKYSLNMSQEIIKILATKRPVKLDNVETMIIGDVEKLTSSAAEIAGRLGFQTDIISNKLDTEAKDAGISMARIVKKINQGIYPLKPPCALIMGGETVVQVKGLGKGGRCQEFVLAATEEISGMDNVIIAALGSDGNDGPTDAAGALVTGESFGQMKGIEIERALAENDSYNVLNSINALIKIGPTGTNVNDLYFALIG